jgi:hypothetical protein
LRLARSLPITRQLFSLFFEPWSGVASAQRLSISGTRLSHRLPTIDEARARLGVERQRSFQGCSAALLVQVETAIDVYYLAGDHVGCRRGQKHQRTDKVVWALNPI